MNLATINYLLELIDKDFHYRANTTEEEINSITDWVFSQVDANGNESIIDTGMWDECIVRLMASTLNMVTAHLSLAKL